MDVLWINFATARWRQASFVHNIGDDGDRVGARGEHHRGPLQGDAANRHQGAVEFCPPFGDAGQALRGPGHGFQRSGIDRAERDIVGLGGKRCLQLRVAVGADADPHVRGPDGGEVGFSQILLAEMHERDAGGDGLAPIVVDDKLAPVRCAKCCGFLDLGADDARVLILDAELHESDALRQKAGEPIRVGDDGVEGIECGQDRDRA